MRLRDVIKATLSRPVAFHAVLGKVCGSATAGLMLSQAIYWSERTNDQNGWFYKTQAEWEEEICLSRWEQETARKRLRERGLLAEQLRGNPARLYYRVEIEAVARAVAQYAEKPQTSLRDARKRQAPALDCGKTANKDAGNPQSLKGTETSSETTTEKHLGNATSALPLSKAKEKSPVEEKPKPADPRFQPVVDAVRRCWPEGTPFAFDPADGAALNRMLAKRPNFSAAQLTECVVFRFWSEGVNSTESVKAWIGAVTDYASGPRNKYGNPVGDVEHWRVQARQLLHPPEQQPPLLRQTPEQSRQSFVERSGGQDGRDAARALLEWLQSRVNRHSYDTWFRPVRYLCMSADGTLYLEAPTRLFRKRITETYADLLREWRDTWPQVRAIGVKVFNDPDVQAARADKTTGCVAV